MNKASRASRTAHLPGLPLFAARAMSALAQSLRNRRGARDLSGLDDFMLKDIGLSRADIFSAAYGGSKRRE